MTDRRVESVTDSGHESSAATTLEVVDVIGRWACLSNGEMVTPIPSFKEMGYDHAAFDRAIARFQRNPAGVINGDGIVERTRGR